MFGGSKGLDRYDRRFWSLDCFIIVGDISKKGGVSENSAVCSGKSRRMRNLYLCKLNVFTMY